MLFNRLQSVAEDCIALQLVKRILQRWLHFLGVAKIRVEIGAKYFTEFLIYSRFVIKIGCYQYNIISEVYYNYGN